MEVVNTGIGVVTKRLVADESMQMEVSEQTMALSRSRPGESLEYHYRILERRFEHFSTETSTSSCSVLCRPTLLFWRQQG